MQDNTPNNENNGQLNYDIVFIGHFAIDTIIIHDPPSKSQSLGGGVTYGSLAAAYYNPQKKIAIISKIGSDFNRQFLDIFNEHSIDLSHIITEGEFSTHYRLEYKEGNRSLKLVHKAADFKIDDIPEKYLNAHAIHLTPIANEFPPEFLKDLASHPLSNNTIFGLDIQGIIRSFDDEGNMIMQPDSDKRGEIYEFLQHFKKRMFLKASDREILSVSGQTDLKKATTMIADECGVNVLTTMGSKGVLFKGPETPLIYVPAYVPRRAVDETGAGDCFMAVFLLEVGDILKNKVNLSEEEVKFCIRMAQAASSFLIEEKGPHGFKSRKEILERVSIDNREKNFYR